MVNISTNSLEKTRCPPKTKKLGLHLEKRTQVSGYDEIWIEISENNVTEVISSLVTSISQTTNAISDIIEFYLPSSISVENVSIETLMSAKKTCNYGEKWNLRTCSGKIRKLLIVFGFPALQRN